MKRIITLMGVLGVITLFFACSESGDLTSVDDSYPKENVNNNPSSTPNSVNSHDTTYVRDSVYRDSVVKKNTTITDSVFVTIEQGATKDLYYSSGIFCWNPGCEEKYSSTTPPKSSSSKNNSSSSNEGASIVVPSEDPPVIEGNIMTDKRDGHTYNLINVSGKLWMAQDLNYSSANSECFNSQEENCAKYGRLYTYSAATKACPAGWRLPTREEVEAVINDAQYVWSYSGRCKEGSCDFLNGMGFHWTNAAGKSGDKNYDSYKDDSSYATIIVEKNPNSDYKDESLPIFFQLDSKNKHFSVRCVQGE